MAIDETGRVFLARGPEEDRQGHYAFQADLVDAAHDATRREGPRLSPDGAQSAASIVVGNARRLSLEGFLQRAPEAPAGPGEK